MVGERWSDKFKLVVCFARELVLPLAEFLAHGGGVVIVNIKLWRSVGVEGIVGRWRQSPSGFIGVLGIVRMNEHNRIQIGKQQRLQLYVRGK